MDELVLRVRNHVYAAFVRDGRVPAPAETAQTLGIEAQAVEPAYHVLHDEHALVLEPDGVRVRMLNPFSVIPTPHVVEAAGRPWYANCAWDALGVPAALRADGVVRSACADCGEPLELEVRGGRLARGSELLVHLLVPARRWWDDIVFT
jgi:Alkylmercury lyase